MRLKHHQSGFSLLILLIVLMGLGGVALANYSQNIYHQVGKNRFEHNKEVLQQAKDALLMFAYNYPQNNTNGVGPGRLPCPDHDNDGMIGSIANCDTVGRLPRRDPRLNFYKAKDASGETLWYAVSSAFDNVAGGGVINSDTVGTITLFDQTGHLIYDGSVAGIAAVIIAPGPAMNGQDRSITNGDDPDDDTADSDPGIIDPANYLDAFNGFDNSSFVNFSNANADGFRLGPVYDSALSTYVINDQMIIITAEEVTAMAEKAVLESYRNAINDYLANTGNVYPWLFNYDVNTVNDIYDYPTRVAFTSNLNNVGRIPSMFTPYFTDNVAASDVVDSELWMQIRFMGITGWLSPGENFTGTARVSITTDGDISFTGLPMYSPADKTFYFWDDVASPDGFELCPAGGDELSDCNRDASGAATPGSASNLRAAIVRRVTMEFNSIAGSDTLDFDDMLVAPDCSLPDNCLSASAGRHAFISASYDETVFNFFVDKVSYEQDDFYLNSFDVTDSGDLSFSGGAGSMRVGIRYYPVLPAWAKTNNWHQSVLMAYAQPYLPGGTGPCIAGTDCLQITSSILPGNDKISLLTIAGSTNIDDDDGDFTNDLSEIFDPGNDDLDDTFDVRAPGGDDQILVMNQL